VTFQCNLDGAGWTACSSPQDYSLPSGSHTFAVRSTIGTTTDPVGDSRTWTIQPPDTKITSGPSNPTSLTSASFAFTSDAENTNYLDYQCKLDSQAWQWCWSTVTYTNLAPGSHTFQVKAQDDDVPSDVDPVGASQTWTIASQPELDVFTAGQGSGAVTSSPAGVTCNPHCTATFPSGTVVTLTATPAVGSVFAGWSGGVQRYR
jgi:large repetitive protein